MTQSLRFAVFAAALALPSAAVLAEGTPVTEGPANPEWVLAEVDGAAPGWSATLNLSEPDRVVGQAPCNRYFAPVSRDGTAFALGPIGATRMACDDLPAEQEFFRLLALMTSAEEQPDEVILTGGGHQMRFVAPKE